MNFFRFLSILPLFVLLLHGCSTTGMKDKADREVYGIIDQKSAQVPNMDPEFTIEPTTELPFWDDLPMLQVTDPSLGQFADEENGSKILSLEQALATAVVLNREYQTQREQLYGRALDLTLQRHEFETTYAGTASTDFASDAIDISREAPLVEGLTQSRDVIDFVETLSGEPAELLREFSDVVQQAGVVYGLDEPGVDVDTEYSIGGRSQIGVQRLLKTGGAFALGLTTNFLRLLTGPGDTTSATLLEASLTQPLLRGAGRRIATEDLTQAERDVLYGIRDFTQFRKDFSVDVAAAYYSVLENRDIVRNTYQSFLNFQTNAERERAFAAEGRRTVAELGRIEAALLENENNWINAIRRYRESLDQFKILLGISTDEPIVLLEDELDTLREQGLRHPELAVDDAVEVALVSRLDVYTARDQLEDAERRIHVAENALLPGLDFVVTGVLASVEEDNFTQVDFRRLDWTAGFDLDLPLNRKSDRNFLRTALILREQAARRYSLTEDNVKLDVRTAWRNLDQARRNYEIALRSVELNERRVEEQNLLAELGRATALNLVDAQNDLTQAQNDLTQALVAHNIARLEFWRDMGILFILDNGQWQELDDESVTTSETTTE